MRYCVLRSVSVGAPHDNMRYKDTDLSMLTTMCFWRCKEPFHHLGRLFRRRRRFVSPAIKTYREIHPGPPLAKVNRSYGLYYIEKYSLHSLRIHRSRLHSLQSTVCCTSVFVLPIGESRVNGIHTGSTNNIAMRFARDK